MKFKLYFIVFIFLFPSHLLADEASKWLKSEIDTILNAYENKKLI